MLCKYVHLLFYAKTERNRNNCGARTVCDEDLLCIMPLAYKLMGYLDLRFIVDPKDHVRGMRSYVEIIFFF